MGKNWLIRTKSNHILGPISKEKVLELLHNSSIKPDDEVCSGNGYWFYIRETELVDKYLLGTTAQGFNPMSEAKDVLTAPSSSFEKDPTRDDITLVSAIDLKKVKDSNTPPPQPIKSVPKTESAPALKVALESDTEDSQKKKVKSEPQAKSSSLKKPVKQNYLRYLGYLIFLILLLMIYFRKSILKSFFQSEASLQPSSLFIATANAQDDESSGKKKSS